MARRSSTPGQRARLYLEAHRDARTTALPGAHKEAREEIMRQLEHDDPHVRERALVGSDKHFDRPLTKPEKAYQQHWQREESLDVGDVRQRRADLEPHQGRRRPANQPPPPPERRPGRIPPRAAQVRDYVRKTAATAGTVPSYVKQTANVPNPPSGGALGLLYASLTTIVAFTSLYLLLTKPKVATSLLGLATQSFNHLASPSNTLFGGTAASSTTGSSASAAISSYLGADAPNPATVGATVGPTGGTPAQLRASGTAAAAALAQQAAAQGLHFDPATDQYVS